MNKYPFLRLVNIVKSPQKIRYLAGMNKEQYIWVKSNHFMKIRRDSIQSIKSLILSEWLSSADLEKAVLFVNLFSDPKIYLMAAQHFRSLEWRSQPEILKHIVEMYKKASSTDILIDFLEECARVEIDENLEYGRAVQALREALCESKNMPPQKRDKKVCDLKHRIQLMESFIRATKIGGTNPSEMVAILNRLLAEPDIDRTVREGDILAHLIRYFHGVQKFDLALSSLRKICLRGIIMKPYLDTDIVDEICLRNNVTPQEIGVRWDGEEIVDEMK